MFDKLKLKKQIKQLKKEVAKENPQAMYDLAKIYLETTLIKVDKNEALELMKRSAKLGNLQAKSYLVTKKVEKGVDVVAKAISDIKKII